VSGRGEIFASFDWSPDGRRLVYSVRRAEGFPIEGEQDRLGLFTVAADGGAARRLSADESGAAWSPQGDRIVFLGL